LSRALDLILTGRAVDAHEALAMGLANRVVADGTARAAAEALALDIARFPERCMKNDRLSAYEQGDLAFDDAMANELRRGLDSLVDAAPGAAAFAGGAGRHGQRAP
jgi:enoyl-CoA hydratase